MSMDWRGGRPLKKVAAVVTAVSALAFGIPVVLGLGSPQAAAQSSADDGAIADFYRSRGGAPLWLAPGSGGAAQQLVQLLSTSYADNLNPRRYNVRGLERAVADARTGNPAAIQRAEVMLSAAFVAYASDQKHDPNVGIIYVDPELKPSPPSVRELLDQAAHRAIAIGLCCTDRMDESDLCSAAASNREPDLPQRWRTPVAHC